MLDRVRRAVRIKSKAFDSELIDLIEAAELDLSIAGVKKIDDQDPLIKQAIVMYCKANFGLDNKDSEKYQAVYDNLKERLCLCSDYNECGDDDE